MRFVVKRKAGEGSSPKRLPAGAVDTVVKAERERSATVSSEAQGPSAVEGKRARKDAHHAGEGGAVCHVLHLDGSVRAICQAVLSPGGHREMRCSVG